MLGIMSSGDTWGADSGVFTFGNSSASEDSPAIPAFQGLNGLAKFKTPFAMLGDPIIGIIFIAVPTVPPKTAQGSPSRTP